MNDMEEIISQIKKLSLHITEDNYYIRIRQGYELLIRLHDLGIEKESVYQAIFQYYNSLEESLSRDYIADILDYTVGWCSPQDRIWSVD